MPSSRVVGRHLVIAVFTLLLLVVVALLGQIPMGRPTGRAIVRLALRTVQGRVEVCRDRTPEELEALPIHMRQPQTCDQYSPRYRLTVALDGRALHEEEVSPGGLRGDRPLIVDRQLVVDPGPVLLEVGFEPIAEADYQAEVRAAFEEIPRYRLDEPVVLQPDRITLVLLDDERGALEIYSP